MFTNRFVIQNRLKRMTPFKLPALEIEPNLVKQRLMLNRQEVLYYSTSENH